jgi:23S rRNA (cytosine1962-C5)-methyltransferase
MELFSSESWKDYELIDTGGLEKLERYGKFILARPEPQAVWEKALAEAKWNQLAHAYYRRAKGQDPSKMEIAEKGSWNKKPEMPDQWMISYTYKEMTLTFRLGLTSFGHIGVFPEQANNWNYVFDLLQSRKGNPARVLNLFAYTGGTSLVAKAAGADVVHVDSVKPVVSWARENMVASRLDNIRWVVEDALKFAGREVKRGNKYSGIILDPPAYGRGPEGEKWVLQDSFAELMGLCNDLLEPTNSFFLLSLYSMGFSALIADNFTKTLFGNIKEKQIGELFVTDRASRRLPLGTLLRFHKEV